MCFKMTVDRTCLIENACSAFEKMSELRSGLPSMGPPTLEVEFLNEVGTGTGPTMEFLTVTSRALRKSHLNLWRSSNVEKSEYVNVPPEGLFPKPLTRSMGTPEIERQEKLFRMMGRLFAISLLDRHLVDLPLSPVFLVAAGFLPGSSSSSMSSSSRNTKDALHLLSSVDREIAESFRKLLALKSEDENDTIASLELPLEIPGSPSYPLRVMSRRRGGRVDVVTSSNVEQYVTQVARVICVEGIAIQAKAFRSGFLSFMPRTNKNNILLDANELLSVVCGSNDEDTHWSETALSASIAFDHGFSKNSKFSKQFLRLMASFDKSQRRAFLCFTTGCPRLPIGGFGALTPPLTVVRKSYGGDSHLPSASTCTHYLKVPEYSDFEVMKEKFRVAILDGSLGFLMS